jgi:radical SAM superfamily enzyme YgiQ (UPF0313 family)
MRILLIAMPDNVDLIDHLVKFPNIAIASLAGNLPGHEVRTMDLVAYGKRIKTPLLQEIESFKPEIIGLSAMTFQFDTLLRISQFIKKSYPDIKLAAGGYHVTLLAEDFCREIPDLPLDFLIRGEGEKAFAELCSQLGEKEPDLTKIEGLSYQGEDNTWIHVPRGKLLDLDMLKPPDRTTRVINNFRLFADSRYTFDVVETSRGCPFICKFCSIRQMYGSTFRTFTIERIIEDLKRIKQAGTKGVFFADDNITYDIDHFRKLCQAIVKNGLNDLFYSVQATAAGIAQNPDLVADMDKANFRIIFVGFESMISGSLSAMKKPTNPEINIQAAKLLKKHKMGIIAGFIVGYPEDTKETVRKSFRALMKLLPDVVYPQYLTPYPKTELREEMLEAGLVDNKYDYSKYDGYTCNIHTKNMTTKELYVALRKEMFLNFLYPSICLNNYLIKQFSFAFGKTIFLNFLTIIWNILTSKKDQSEFDL